MSMTPPPGAPLPPAPPLPPSSVPPSNDPMATVAAASGSLAATVVASISPAVHNATSLLAPLMNETIPNLTGMVSNMTVLPNATHAAANASSSTNATAAKIAAAKQAAMKAYLESIYHKYDTLQYFMLFGYGMMCFLCFVLICYMRYHRNIAFRGDATAARKIILPAFEPLLWILGILTGSYSIFFIVAITTNMYDLIPKVATECFYSGRQFVFVIVIVYMLQKSVTVPALRRTVIIAFFLSTYTIPVVWYFMNHGSEEQLYWAQTISRSLLLLLYSYVFIRPPGRASKRTLREFCVYTYVYYALLFSYNEMFHQKRLEAGFNLTYANLLIGSMCPLVIWRVLKADTEHWRGMGQRACALQCLFRQKNNIHERISSQGLHVLIEMHRKYIIDFAYLELKQRIGMGASAVVFNGILHSKIPVAIKVYTPNDLTEETVAEFSHEAALCGALHHPNIVKFYGMCVCPPTICLVSELCQGSLEDVINAISRRENPPERQQFLINLGYMIDAARAVAYIHSFSPAFIHRDIKPGNFLVDAECNVKLTDFGESRSLPKAQLSYEPGNAHHISVQKSGEIIASEYNPTTNHRNSNGGGYAGSASMSRMTVRGTVDYMAPEIINGKAGLASYGEAADVYSLAITMWDILNPGREKYPTLRNNHLQVFEFVVDGNRPILNESLHPNLRELIESSWSSHAHLRPSAQNIVTVLESIQEEVLASFALTLSEKLAEDDEETSPLVAGECSSKTRTHGSSEGSIEEVSNVGQMNAPYSKCFTGEDASDKMEDCNYVNSPNEAVRLGNALMDAGLLHHSKHNRPFEKSANLYYFDEENIHLCRPLNMITDANGSTTTGTASVIYEEDDSSLTMSMKSKSRKNSVGPQSSAGFSSAPFTIGTRSERQPQGLQNGMCACRKYGQRTEHAKVSRARRFRRKFKPVPEESMLTTKLLAEDETAPREDEFDGFDGVTAAA